MKWPFSKKPKASSQLTSADQTARGDGASAASHAGRDATLRAVFEEKGDDGRTPRHTIFYFYDGDHQALLVAAAAAGFAVRPTVNNDGVVMETTMAIDDSSFAPVRAQMLAWAEEFGCEYDGWEAAMVAN